jgi:uncharacterized RDD family membrane protein YckC
MRFDEIELQPVTFDVPPAVAAAPVETAPEALSPAPRMKRLAALLTDLSLFAALSLALSPLLPSSMSALSVSALAGFVIVVSYYYYVGSWLLWGKTIGGAIFDVKVVAAGTPAIALTQASRRWAATYLSLLTAMIGFLLAALPGALSLPDRLSDTRCVTA